MSKTSLVKPAAVEENLNPAVSPEASDTRQELVQNVVPQEVVGESFKTLQLLKGWPLVLFILNKGEETYKSVKHSTKVTEIGLNISEKVATAVTNCTGNIIQKIKPVLKLVDNPASEGLERLEKNFPVVKESPEKIYDSVVGRLVSFISPAVNTAVMVTEVGRKQVKRTTKTIVKSSRKVIALVENRLERFEQYMAGTRLEIATEQSGQASTSLESEAVAGTACARKLRAAAGACLRSATSLFMFWLGTSFWLLERLPLVGRFLSETPASPSRSSGISTASSYSSLADEPAAEEARGSQLPPEIAEATQ
ncbi:uncharacterized protein LOC126176707 [Schistocerca cancellata]|uniref:uncharacterized protein LOC126176707 n=1 Tax=Schistocerca cancellata TaxID=274614 RepID=UPI00211818A9|nr:uncharacterized protein LOC126176707 [Schistocerca cancellata]